MAKARQTSTHVPILLRPCCFFFISALRPLTVAVELDALDVEPARGQAYVAALVRRGAVQPGPGLPLPVHIFSSPRRKDADQRVTGRVRLEDDDEPRAGNDELVRPRGDDQPARRRVA